MMGERRVMQEALFYGFSLERHVPDSHMLRKIDRFVDLSGLRSHLGPYYSDVGRPSIDPELMIRMLIVGYCFGIRSERRLCEEVHLNLAYRWFCRLGLDGDVPDHSTFSKNRHGRFRESDLLRKLFKTVVARCIKEGVVGGEAIAVDASMIVADAHRRRSVAKVEDLDPSSSRAVAEYLSVLDDAAFGGATPVEPKAISPTDPAARYTASANSVAGYAYSDNYLIDLKHAPARARWFRMVWRVIGCGHVSGLQARPVTTAGRYGDARTRRKSPRRAFELDGIYCISWPGSDRSFALTVPRPPHTPDVPLAAQPDRGSEGRSHRTSIIFPLCQHGPD